MSNRGDRELKSVAYEIFMLLTSTLSMVNVVLVLAAQIWGPVLDQSVEVLVVMEATLTPIFLTDFLYRLLTARSRRTYFFAHMGWTDMLAIVPLLRVFRVIRMIAAVRSLRELGRDEIAAELDQTRAKTTFLVTIFLVFLVVEVAGATIYGAESRDPSSNISSAGDAIWWGLVTITTVGYGDYYPVTPEGRIIGVFLLFAGIALFSVLTGFIANAFLAPRRRRLLARPPADERATIATVRALVAEQEERNAAILVQLDELERSIRGASTEQDATKRA